MTTLRIRGGRIFDPTNNENGVAREICVRDGRIVAPFPQGARVDNEVDAHGAIVMAGGIDMHSHIGGGKVNLARMLLPEDHRGGPAPSANGLELASCGHCSPGTLSAGYRYTEMGYTAVFEPAMLPSNARQAHFEMGDTPIIDHGAYVMLGNDDLFLRLLAENTPFERIRNYVGWTINASKALGVKVVNPAGISAFKFNQRALDVDEQHVH
jgi:formylmethanofuran dehydrogenase subunit A